MTRARSLIPIFNPQGRCLRSGPGAAVRVPPGAAVFFLLPRPRGHLIQEDAPRPYPGRRRTPHSCFCFRLRLSLGSRRARLSSCLAARLALQTAFLVKLVALMTEFALFSIRTRLALFDGMAELILEALSCPFTLPAIGRGHTIRPRPLASFTFASAPALLTSLHGVLGLVISIGLLLFLTGCCYHFLRMREPTVLSSRARARIPHLKAGFLLPILTLAFA